MNIPGTWQTVPLSEIVDFNPGIDKSKFANDTEVSFVAMPAVEAETGRVDTTERRLLGDVKTGFTAFQSGDVLFAKITPCMENGKMAVVPEIPGSVGFGSTEFHVLRPGGAVLAKLIYYFVSSSAVRYEAQHQMTGAVGQKRVPRRYLETKPFPLPPLKEQYRIVEKIETLFSQLDAGEAALRTVQKLLARYRQSVLKAAVTGALTADWRAQNAHRLEHGRDLLTRILQTRRENWQGRGKYQEPPGPDNSEAPELPDGWEPATTEQLAFVETGATPKKGTPEFYKDGNIPWITSTAVNDQLILSSQDFITEQAIKKTNAKVFPVGSLIVAMYGEGKTRGMISELGIEAATNQACAALIVIHLPKLIIDYLKIFYKYNYEKVRLLSSGGVQPNLNLSIIKRAAIPLPGESEIEEIVGRISEEMEQIASLEKACQSELTRSAALRQSILKDAFSGKLVTQDPGDEPAAELLARIRAERQQADAAPARGRKSSKKTSA